MAGAAAGLPLLFTPAMTYAATGSTLDIVIDGLLSARGNVHVEVCPKQMFLKDCPYAGEVRAQAGSVTIMVPNIPPGIYAVQATHDENDDHKLNRGLFGVPKEGFAFSQNVRVCMGPPKFDKAAFEVPAYRSKIVIHMAYKICESR